MSVDICKSCEETDGEIVVSCGIDKNWYCRHTFITPPSDPFPGSLSSTLSIRAKKGDGAAT